MENAEIGMHFSAHYDRNIPTKPTRIQAVFVCRSKIII